MFTDIQHCLLMTLRARLDLHLTWPLLDCGAVNTWQSYLHFADMLLAISKEHRLDRHKISPSSSRFPSSQDVMESMITATTKPSRPAKPPRGSLLTRSIPSKPQTDDSHNNSSPTSKTTIKVTMPVKKSRITPIGHHRNFIEINKSNVSRSNSGDNNVAINHQQSGNRSFRSSRLFNGSFSRADILDSSIDDSSSLESSPSLTIDNSNSNRRPTAIPIPIPPTRVSRPIGLSKYNFKASSLAQLPTSDIMADSPTSPTTPFLKSVPSSMSNEFQENRQRLQRQLTSTGFGIRFNSGRQHVFQNHAYPLNRDFTSLRNGVTNNNLNKTENGKDHGDHHPIDLPSPSSPSSSSSHYQPPKHPTCLHQMNVSVLKCYSSSCVTLRPDVSLLFVRFFLYMSSWTSCNLSDLFLIQLTASFWVSCHSDLLPHCCCCSSNSPNGSSSVCVTVEQLSCVTSNYASIRIRYTSATLIEFRTSCQVTWFLWSPSSEIWGRICVKELLKFIRRDSRTTKRNHFLTKQTWRSDAASHWLPTLLSL